MIERVYTLLLTVAAITCITYGAATLCPPCWPLVLGGCLWVDLYLGRRLRGARR